MSRFRQIITSPQIIKQLWMGVPSTGFIAGSGGYSKITDVNHPGYRERLGSGDVGGPMVLHRQLVTCKTGRCLKGNGKGSAVALRVSSWGSDPTEPLASTLYGLGGTAIARSTPTNPAFAGLDSAAQMIGRDAIPKAMGSSMWKAQTLHFRDLGKEYLNLAFGWAPFVSDILSVCKAVKNSHEYMENLRRGSDRLTRVGYHFPEETTDYVPTSGFSLYSVSSSIIGWGAGPVVASGTSGQRVWFNGAFKYHIPGLEGNLSQSQRFTQYADHVLGVRLTPEVLWDMAPWTWMADWAINVGDVARNIGNFHRDGLYMPYGYIMAHKYRKETYTTTGLNGAVSNLPCTGVSTTKVSEWKTRYPASPYGFGLTYDGLSGSQKAILAAVGISHF